MPTHPDSSLEAGLTALKQGDYTRAIAHLEAVSQSYDEQQPKGFQALRGLVVAYERIGEVSKAIALCQSVSNSNNLQVREWAIRTQAKLTNRYRNEVEPSANITGFVPFDSSPPPNRPIAPIAGQQQQGRMGGRGETQRVEKQEQQEINNDSIPQSSSSPTLPITPAVKPLRTHTPELNINWQQAGRAKQWSKLKAVNVIPLWLLAVGTLVALFWVMRWLLKLAMTLTNDILVKLPFLEPVQLFYRDPSQFLLLVLVILLGVSPWLLDGLLIYFYGRQHLSIDTLAAYSPEASRVLQRYCRQRGWHLPKLSILPLAAPVALTYGNLPRTTRIVVSQGLLEQLADDEIATIYAGELGHIARWDFVVMSVVLVVTILPYLVYQQLSKWGDRISNKILRWVVGAIANLAYLVWCILSATALWLSQLRLYYSDRIAAEITGNPNGLTRGLLKIAIGIAQDVEKQAHTSWQLESLNLLNPVGYQQSLSLGSLALHTAIEPLLAWGCLNPYRWWFVINNSHPLMGDRLQQLAKIARHWYLETELNLESPGTSPRVRRQSFLLQIAPWLGIPLGFALAAAIWLIWQVAFSLELFDLRWIYDDSSFIVGCLLIGFSVGILLRINSFFPDIKPGNVQTDPNLSDLLANPAVLPIDSIGVRLQGKLLGRRGVSNWLGQDLILHSKSGLVKLHYISLPGQSLHPSDVIGRQVILTGWFRRGATPWIDIETLQTQAGKTINSAHPIWSTLVGVGAAAWGAYILLTS